MRKFKINTISKKLCISVGLVGLALSILISLIIYPIIFSVFRNNSIQNLTQISKQSINYIDNVIDQYELYSRFINNDEYLYQLIEAYKVSENTLNQEKISTRLSEYLSIFSGINGISIISEGNTMLANIGNTTDSVTITKSEWYISYKTNGYSRHFSNFVDSDGNISEDDNEEKYLFLSYPYQHKEIEGDLIFLLPFSVFDEALKTFVDNELEIILFGRDDSPIYQYTHNNTSINLGSVTNIISNPGINYQETSENSDGIDLISYSQRGGWKLVVNISDNYIFANFSTAFYIIYFLQLILLISFVVSLWIMISRRLKPLHVITKQINKVSEENINISIDIKSGDELEELATSFNKMIVRIQQYLAERIEHNNREKQMEYALFVAQVNPHFIYKTLNVITYMAETNQNKALVDVNRSLISILKDRLRISKTDVFDILQKEIEVVEAYLTIQRARYGDCIKFQKEIDDNLFQQKIPKNILQPLTENAVFHGILANQDESMNIIGGTIKLKIEDQGEMIEIQLTDNGQGMSPETIKKFFIENENSNTDKGRHIGIKNIKKRLSYIYGDNFSFKVISDIGVGTKIIIVIKKEVKDENC